MNNYSKYNVKERNCVNGAIPSTILEELITDECREAFLEWLTPEGLNVYKGCSRDRLIGEHIMGAGMQVRNWMRKRDEFIGFTDCNYDDNWIEFMQSVVND